MNVRSVLRECALDLLETESKVSAEHVVRCAYQRHGAVFSDATDKMVRDLARRMAADIMRGLSDDDGGDQLTIPGLGFPTAIAVVTPDGTYWVRADKATWNELKAGRQQRLDNVNAAVRKLDSYDEGMETVRPHMEHDPDGIQLHAAIEDMKRGG